MNARSLLELVVLSWISYSNSLKAILLGSTGTVGFEVLRALTGEELFEEVILVGRNAEKIRSILTRGQSEYTKPSPVFKNVHVSDLNKINDNEDLKGLKADACFIAVGVGHPYKLDLQSWHSIEVDMVSSIARFCNNAQVRYIALLSAITAEKEPAPFSSSDLDNSDKSSVGWWGMLKSYDRIKGLEEQAVIHAATNVSTVSMFQPNTILTNEYRYGIVDRTFFMLHKFLDPIIPSMYHSVHAQMLGVSIVEDAVQKLTSKSPPNVYCSVLENAHGSVLKVFRLTYNDFLKLANSRVKKKNQQVINSRREL